MVALAIVGGVVALAVACLVSIAYGSRSLSWGSIADALVSFDATNFDHLAVQSRIPRTATGLLVGIALALGGAVLQGVARNPLADPGLLGVNAGASLAIVSGIVLFDVTSGGAMVWLGFLGAAVATAVVFGVASLGRAGATPVKLALAGAAVSAALLSVLSAFLLVDIAAFDRFRFWQVGSLAGRSLELVGQVAPFVAVGAIVALGCGRMLNGLALGDDVARGLGQRVVLNRALAIGAVIVLSGAGTAAAGPIIFVGLAVPHVARAIVGSDYRWVLAFSALLGPTLLLFADVLGRVLLSNGELQVGIVTAFLGAPAFILLVRRRKLAEL